jgi:gas vesicle protein
MGRANEATPSTGEVKQAGRKAVGTAQENPLGLAVGAAAVGFMAGMLMPSTRVENEKIGETADQMKSQIKDTASEAVERGKQVAQDAAQSAQETVKESGQQQAQELAASASPQS